MDPTALAVASERLLRPGARVLAGGERPGAGRTLLVRPAAVPIAPLALALQACTTDADWARYAVRRVEVEAGFGLDPEQARALVRRTRERTGGLGLRLWLAAGPDGDLVGAVGAFLLPADAGTARLQEVDVFPGHRGRGHGDALLEAVRRRLAADGVGRLLVGADEDDWPLGWYRGRGFRPVARVSRAAPQRSHGDDGEAAPGEEQR
ncbi:GNAT family N-acetyltransferase [Geodermatophilus sp. DF01-2]|uniref:GNAT family N-acetyltransferase n=1 Tax=Geodermatophilus sp. DF01-2 TaxID=2559610 RepID=UPI001072F34A|nr:GNAT family N-acetyltransferase [Geodermatophilus sp. DF01_2]TFV53898.1 GNAT family N-acetyltransferase [Geodermatophilus sp. DF01_2]